MHHELEQCIKDDMDAMMEEDYDKLTLGEPAVGFPNYYGENH